MRRVKAFLFVLWLICIFATVGIHQQAMAANIVMNGDFTGGYYTSTIDSNTNTLVPNDWMPNPAFDLYAGYNRIDMGSIPGITGDTVSIGDTDSEPAASISQVLTTVAGATYTVSFELYNSGLSDPGSFFNASIVGTTSGIQINGDPSSYETQYETFSFTGTGSDILAFTANTTPGEWYIGDVVVSEQSTVPEPSALLLLGFGLGGVGFLNRRIRNLKWPRW